MKDLKERLYKKGSNEEKCKYNSTKQIVAAFIVNSSVIHLGLMFSFSAIALPNLQSSSSEIKINESQASWIASIASFATPPACILGGILMDKFGRRWTLLFVSIPCIFGWILLGTIGIVGDNYFAIYAIYIARISQGIGTGIIAGVSRVYTSEISGPKLRGSLCSLASLGVSTGVLIGFSLGALFSWPIMALLSAFLPFTTLILTWFYIPETPTWLLQRNKWELARQSLLKLRDENISSENIQNELFNLDSNRESKNFSKIKVLKDVSTIKRLAILIFYFYIYQFSSIGALTFYNIKIIEKTGAEVDPYKMAVIFSTVRIVCNIIGCRLLTLFDRKTLTLLSGTVSSLAVLIFATHSYMNYLNLLPEGIFYKYLPIACLMSFYITYSFGFLLVPWVLLGELYPAKIRGFLGGITACFAHISLFLAVKTYPMLLNTINFHGAFYYYGINFFIGSILLYIILPETRGKTLLEIEKLI